MTATSAALPLGGGTDATRASRPDPIKHEQALRLIESFLRFPVQEVTIAVSAPRSRPANGSVSPTGTPRSSKPLAHSVAVVQLAPAAFLAIGASRSAVQSFSRSIYARPASWLAFAGC